MNEAFHYSVQNNMQKSTTGGIISTKSLYAQLLPIHQQKKISRVFKSFSKEMKN